MNYYEFMSRKALPNARKLPCGCVLGGRKCVPHAQRSPLADAISERELAAAIRLFSCYSRAYTR